jgi:hypothetical protein
LKPGLFCNKFAIYYCYKEISMRELTLTEVNSVSGGNVGEIIVGGVKLINDLFNTPLLSFPGRLLDAIGLGSIHHALDSIGFAIFTTIASLGSALGGDASQINYHFNEEWGD